MHRGKKLCLLMAGGMLAASGVAASPAGAADEGDGHRMLGQARGQSVPLSEAKIEKLREANQRNGPLSQDQVFRIAGIPEPTAPAEPAAAPRTAPDTTSMAEEGEERENGECSIVTLWGNSDGRWEWENWYKPTFGEAAFGSLEVDTDGFGSIGSPVWNFDGPHQSVEGSTIFVGPGADYTHAFAWSVNTGGGGALCYSSLTAYWE